MPKLNKNSAKYYLISLFLSGICGYISIARSLGISLLELLIHPSLIYIILNSCSIIWAIFGIFKLIKKQQISFKEIIFNYLFLPCIIFSIIGHLGNGDAISILFGNFFGTIYYYLLIIFYVYLLFLIAKDRKGR